MFDLLTAGTVHTHRPRNKELVSQVPSPSLHRLFPPISLHQVVDYATTRAVTIYIEVMDVDYSLVDNRM